MEVGTKVKIKSFNNTTSTPHDCDFKENYWSLIGEKGTIVKPTNEHFRVLVQIDDSPIQIISAISPRFKQPFLLQIL